MTGKAYTSEQTQYDGAGQLVSALFSGVSGAAYSSYEYDYVGGVFAGSKFTITGVPSGASFSSYEVDYDQANALAAEKFFFTNISGQSYTGEEEDLDGAGNLTRVVLTGVTGQAYNLLEEDFSAGTYEGYKAYYLVSGASYTNVEVDASAAGALEKVVYSGMSSTPYTSVEDDYSGGALSAVTYGFTNVAGQSYYTFGVNENAAGVAQQETTDLNSGGHDLTALASGQTLTSLGDDLMTGNGATTFVFNAIYGADTIANFNANDMISLPLAEFASFSALTGAAVQSGANVVISAADGDSLTLENMTTTALKGMAANFKLHG